jgi:hypothetical protein
MKTQEFLSLLEQHQDKSLVFQYAPNKLVGTNYHITEVKNITIESVDCGAGTDSWKETIVQLWESPSEIGKTEYMSVYKALSILKKVNRMRTMEAEAELKFEYSNETFHTAQLHVNDFEIKEKQLLFILAVTKTDCKAKETCGVPETAVATEEPCCAPDGNCC